MKTMRSFTRFNTGAKVGRSAALLIHHADLDRVARQAEQVLHRVEQIIGERTFFRPVHLGLHDVDGAVAAVAVFRMAVRHRARQSRW